MRTATLFLLGAALAAAAGCGDNNTPTTPSGPTTDLSIARTELFQGTIPPGGTAFYSFSVLADRNVTFTFATLTDSAGRPLDLPLTLGFGVPQGTGCGVRRSVTTTPSLRSQFDNGTAPGTYCVNLADTGALAAAASFTVRIYQAPTPAPAAESGSATFASQLTPGGVATRTFKASQTGTADLTLESASSDTRLGLGIGLPRTDGSGCVPTRTVEVTPGGGPHISMPVDVGTYCVRVFDIGALTGPVAFSVKISYP